MVAVACAVAMGGCHESEGLRGLGDASADLVSDPVEEGTITSCGNGDIDLGEECDDGDRDDCNGCDNMCRWQRALQVERDYPGATVELSDSLCIPCPFTVEAWFRLDISDTSASLFALPGLLTFSVARDNFVYQIGDHPFSAEPVPEGPIEARSWHHLAITCVQTGSQWSITHSLDGKFGYGGDSFESRPHWSCEDEMEIASVPYTYGFVPMPYATVDELRISSEGLYEPYEEFIPERRPEVTEDTVAMWTFNTEEPDGVIPDISGNGHDALLVHGHLVPDDCHMP
jgi:cysteine-rich repeat protein